MKIRDIAISMVAVVACFGATCFSAKAQDQQIAVGDSVTVTQPWAICANQADFDKFMWLLLNNRQQEALDTGNAADCHALKVGSVGIAEKIMAVSGEGDICIRFPDTPACLWTYIKAVVKKPAG